MSQDYCPNTYRINQSENENLLNQIRTVASNDRMATYMVMLKCYAMGHMLVFVAILLCRRLHLRFLFALPVKFVDEQLVFRK